MENVDEIILHQLRSIGIEFDDEVAALRDLTTDAVFRSISGCLRVISPEKSGDLLRQLPPAMSARYSACGKLAELIKGLGYRGDIGYQTILYCSETDIRNVLSFLIERLPREHADVQASAEMSRYDQVMKAISAEITAQLNRSWIPPRYRSLVEAPTQPLETVPLLELLMQSSKVSILQQTKGKPAVLSASIVDALAMAKSAESNNRHSSKVAVEIDQFKDELKAAIQAAALQARIAGKMAGKAGKTVVESKQSAADEKAAAEDEERLKREKVEALRSELQRLKEELNSLLTEVGNLGRKRGELERESEALGSEIERTESELSKRELIAGLLPNAAENIEKLQASIQQRRAKIEQLRLQWLELKAQLEAQLDRLTGSQDAEERRQLERRLAEAERDREDIVGEIGSKEEALKALEAELEKAPKDVSRSVYTKRIIDMIGNTKKQKNEIQKIAADTRSLQKELNSLNEKVDRAFHIADEMVFKDSKRDESARKMYRLLAGMHQDFAATVGAVDDTGSLNRDLDDTEAQVELESRKGWQERADKIAQDLKAIRTETVSG